MNLDGLLGRLAEMETSPAPFVSLYLDAQPDQSGHPRYETFVRKQLQARVESYPARSLERDSLARDAARIRDYLAGELRPAAKGAAIFACAGAGDVFDAVQLEVPVDRHHLFVSNAPHVYPLAWLNDQYRRFAVLLVDSHTARLFVFETGASIADRQLTYPKIRRSAGGGWSQARYQRHLEHEQLHRAKAAIEALEHIVLEHQIERIVLACDDVIVPVVRDQLPKALEGRVVAVLSLDIRASETEILRAGLQAVREWDGREDAEKVVRLLDAQRGYGRGVVGIRATRAALDRGQVEELLLTAPPDRLPLAPGEAVQVSEDLVRAALRRAARLTFVEDPSLLAAAEGVGALLRYAA